MEWSANNDVSLFEKQHLLPEIYLELVPFFY